MGDWNPNSISEFKAAIGRQLKPVSSIFDIDKDDKAAYTEELYLNYKKLFNFITKTYGIITVPVGTLLFHSNQYFCDDILTHEPIGSSMLIQDIKQYVNKDKDNFSKFFMTEYSPRVYCNFTPAANFYVQANFNVSEGGYVATKELYFFQLPFVSREHLKDTFSLTSTVLFKKYIEEKNKELGKIFSGFILSTIVDIAPLEDTNATRIPHDRQFAYPEILLTDGFTHLKKFMQYDIYESLPFPENKDDEEYVSKFVDRLSMNMAEEMRIRRININSLLEEIKSVSTKTKIGQYGTLELFAYIKNKEIPEMIRKVYEDPTGGL
jgi:hypothetical protein